MTSLIPIDLPILLPVATCFILLAIVGKRFRSGRRMTLAFGMFCVVLLIFASTIARFSTFYLAVSVHAAAGSDLGVVWHPSQIGVGVKNSVPFIAVFAVVTFILYERAKQKGWLK